MIYFVIPPTERFTFLINPLKAPMPPPSLTWRRMPRGSVTSIPESSVTPSGLKMSGARGVVAPTIAISRQFLHASRSSSRVALMSAVAVIRTCPKLANFSSLYDGQVKSSRHSGSKTASKLSTPALFSVYPLILGATFLCVSSCGLVFSLLLYAAFCCS